MPRLLVQSRRKARQKRPLVRPWPIRPPPSLVRPHRVRHLAAPLSRAPPRNAGRSPVLPRVARQSPALPSLNQDRQAPLTPIRISLSKDTNVKNRKLASLLAVAGGLAVAAGIPSAPAFAQCAGRSAARCGTRACAGAPCAGKPCAAAGCAAKPCAAAACAAKPCAAKPCAAKPHRKHHRTRRHHS